MTHHVQPMHTWRIGLLMIAIVTTTASAHEPVFRAVEIDKAIDIGYAVAIGEMNGDGRPDVGVRHMVWQDDGESGEGWPDTEG